MLHGSGLRCPQGEETRGPRHGCRGVREYHGADGAGVGPPYTMEPLALAAGRDAYRQGGSDVGGRPGD